MTCPFQQSRMLGELGRTCIEVGFLLAQSFGLGGERIALFADLRQAAGEERVAFFEPLPLLFGVLLNAGELRAEFLGLADAQPQFGKRLVLASSGDGKLCRFAFGFLPCAIELGPLHGQYRLAGIPVPPRAG